MRKKVFILFSMFLPLMAIAQNTKDTMIVTPSTNATSEGVEVFSIVEEDPEFPGGEKGRLIFLRDNLKYPERAREKGIEGTVYIKFVIEKDGSVSNAKILRDVAGGLGAEALRVVKMMPKWKPGKQKGKIVRCAFTLPIKFVLRD